MNSRWPALGAWRTDRQEQMATPVTGASSRKTAAGRCAAAGMLLRGISTLDTARISNITACMIIALGATPVDQITAKRAAKRAALGAEQSRLLAIEDSNSASSSGSMKASEMEHCARNRASVKCCPDARSVGALLHLGRPAPHLARVHPARAAFRSRLPSSAALGARRGASRRRGLIISPVPEVPCRYVLRGPDRQDPGQHGRGRIAHRCSAAALRSWERGRSQEPERPEKCDGLWMTTCAALMGYTLYGQYP